jgi:hypothetical protein
MSTITVMVAVKEPDPHSGTNSMVTPSGKPPAERQLLDSSDAETSTVTDLTTDSEPMATVADGGLSDGMSPRAGIATGHVPSSGGL